MKLPKHIKAQTGYWIRFLFSLLPAIGLIPRPDKREKGISVIMRVKNEEDWIEPSIYSIINFADEIVIVDNGSKDRTIHKLEQIKNKFGEKIKLYSKPDLNLIDVSNYALSKTTYHWIIRWDGDMIARTSGPNAIYNLRKKLLSLNSNRYYVIYLSHIQLTGDIFHQDPLEKIHTEDYIFTYSKSSQFIFTGKYEGIKIPKYFRIIKMKTIYSFHVHVKPAWRMLQKKYWLLWLEKNDYHRYPDLDSFIKDKRGKEYSKKNLSPSDKNEFIQLLQKLIPYKKEKYGES